MTNSWQETFGRRRPEEMQAARGGSVEPLAEGEPDIAPPPDPREYKPWILQRGGRPAMFLDLRRFEPKTGDLIGTQMSYPHLIAIDYIGDRMVSLDFGARQFVVEGTGLSELPGRLQQGMVLAIQEFSSILWKSPTAERLVTRIVPLSTTQAK